MSDNHTTYPWSSLSLLNGGRTLIAVGPYDDYWTKRMKEVQAGTNEPEVTYVLHHFADKDTIFLDGGANIGVWSGYASAAIRNPKQVIAVEASPTTLKRLQRNCMLNGEHGDAFTIVAKALWSKAGESITLNELDSHVHNTAILRPGQVARNQVSVETTTIDHLVDEAFRANSNANKVIVKLDIQDAEREALAGGVKTLATRDVLVIYEDARTSPNSETTASLLQQGLNVYHIDKEWKGHRIRDVADLKPIKLPPRNGYNFLACKPGSAMDLALAELCEKSRDLSSQHAGCSISNSGDLVPTRGR